MKSTTAFLLFFCMSVVMTACNSSNKNQRQRHAFDEQAHRGGRGLMPENTIAAQKNAINFGCTLEMDLQMTKDRKIVVSHDPYVNGLFALTPEGDTMTAAEGRKRLLFDMAYDSIRKYDVGMKPFALFPRQKKMHAVKPLLSVLIDSVETYARSKNHINHYNIEIKSGPETDGRTYSSLEDFVDSALNIILRKGIASRTMIQSFDVRALRLVWQKYPKVKVSYLVSEPHVLTPQAYIHELGFKPDIFSPQYTIVTADMVSGFHKLNVLVIPWTINTSKEIQHLKDLGVDGAISDYPDLFAEVR